ncbi:MAG: hypothetical protein ACXWLI_06170, partial [Myxococcaceae bacterium]
MLALQAPAAVSVECNRVRSAGCARALSNGHRRLLVALTDGRVPSGLTRAALAAGRPGVTTYRRCP